MIRARSPTHMRIWISNNLQFRLLAIRTSNIKIVSTSEQGAQVNPIEAC